jgi:hypothetical protein
MKLPSRSPIGTVGAALVIFLAVAAFRIAVGRSTSTTEQTIRGDVMSIVKKANGVLNW